MMGDIISKFITVYMFYTELCVCVYEWCKCALMRLCALPAQILVSMNADVLPCPSFCHRPRKLRFNGPY